jgi:BolA protein
MNMQENIRNKISQAFKPKNLEVIDESHKHAGHSGWRESGETHFKVVLSAEAFAGMSRIERGRAVFNAIDYKEMGVHAIELVFEDAQ